MILSMPDESDRSKLIFDLDYFLSYREPELLPIFTRGSNGTAGIWAPPSFKEFEAVSPAQCKTCKSTLFSPDGTYFAFADGLRITILKAENWQTVAVIENTKAYHLSFSPKGTFLATWEPFIDNGSIPPRHQNVKIYKSEGGELFKDLQQRSSACWEPQWSSDETAFCILYRQDVVFYKNLNSEFEFHGRLAGRPHVSCSMCPKTDAYFIVAHELEKPGEPSLARLFKFPDFNRYVTTKGFTPGDRVDYFWNPKNGDNVLLMASTGVDETDGSYNGREFLSLHFMCTNSFAGQPRILDKEGPIYSVQWSPKKNDEFCVIYGHMPAKATIFAVSNIRCYPIIDLGTGFRNAIYYNSRGSYLILAGLGKLGGKIEVWKTTINKKKEKLIDLEAPNSTSLAWTSDGYHFVTATTAPRFQTGNGFKVWHYSGSVLHEVQWPEGEELYDVVWKLKPKSAK